MLIVFGLIAVLFVIGYIGVRREQARTKAREDAGLLRIACEQREFARAEAKAASLAALQKTADAIREERARKIAELGLVTAVPPAGAPERRKTAPKKKAKKGRK
jgi:hypothetical protein